MRTARSRADCANDDARSPEAKSAVKPPRPSIAVNKPQAASATSCVRFSTNHEPPAGSMTRPTCDSSMSSALVLRARRRDIESGKPRAASKGRTVTLCAPPTPAPNAATVPRNKLTQGSRRLNIDQDVTTCWRMAPAPATASCCTPETSATRDHNCRAARNLAIVANWSAVALRRNSTWVKAKSTLSPASTRARTYSVPIAMTPANSCASVAPASCKTKPSATNERM